MRWSTIAEYNSKDRALEFCVDIYFDGVSNDPLHCTRDNYLVDCYVLDEACSDTDTFIGAPSANELSFQLFGSSGLFNPLNADSEYYGKITTGVPIRVYCRPIDLTGKDEYDWDQLGLFYVSDWKTDLTGITADITALDKLGSLISTVMTKVPVVSNQTYEALIRSFMTKNGITPAIVGDLTEVLSFGFINSSNSDFLQAFSIGALAFIYCNHEGAINVLDIDQAKAIKYVLTDNDQIVSVKSTQSILNKYSGVSLSYVKAQLSDDSELLNNRQQEKVTAYTETYQNQGFSKTPVYAVTRAEIEAATDIQVSDYTATAQDITYKLVGNAQTFNIAIYGNYIEFIDIDLSDGSDNDLYIKSQYVQDAAYAARLKGLLSKYVSMQVPVLELEVRGNPLIEIGAKVHIVSEMYNVDFIGIVIRQSFKYDGGLSGTMTVLSSEIVGD